MKTIRVFGDYSIVSEKVDKCPCKYDDSIIIIALIDAVISIFFVTVAAELEKVIFLILFLIIGCIGFFGGFIIREFLTNCGIQIELRHNKQTYYDGFSIFGTKLYQFTNNSDYDANQIINIIDDLEKYANEVDIANKAQEDEKRAEHKTCCNKYKSVIAKVK
jgi:hypothetical protein